MQRAKAFEQEGHLAWTDLLEGNGPFACQDDRSTRERLQGPGLVLRGGIAIGSRAPGPACHLRTEPWSLLPHDA